MIQKTVAVYDAVVFEIFQSHMLANKELCCKGMQR